MARNKYYALWFSLAIFIIFIMQTLFPAITDLFKLTSLLVLTKPWTLLTAIFLHGSITHLLYNLFALALFGTILEHNIGSKRFLYVFFVSGLFASIASVPFYNSVLGASGAIFGVIGTLTILKPKMVIWMYGMPMPMFLAAIIWAVIDILGIFAPGNTANMAHLAGLFSGFVIAFLIRKKQLKTSKTDFKLDEDEFIEWEDSYIRR